MSENRRISFTVAECSEFHNNGQLHENIQSIKEAEELFMALPKETANQIHAIGIRSYDAAIENDYVETDIFTGDKLFMDRFNYLPDIMENTFAQYSIAQLIYDFPKVEIIGEVPREIHNKAMSLLLKKDQEDKIQELIDKLEEGVQNIFGSDEYKELLSVMAKMPHYSVNNQILIAMQTGGQATLCQSFTGWKEMGRYVKKGESGIKIFAPAPYTIQKEVDKVDEHGKTVFDSDGEAVKETEEVVVNAFKVVSTFDISQTDGKELPQIGVDELTGDVDQFSTFMEAVKATCPVPIKYESIPGNVKGYYNQMDKNITINKGMSEVQTVKTLLHEMAHQRLHDCTFNTIGSEKTRNAKEVEAESVAFVVCQHYGIDTSEYSFGYVAGWSKGKKTPELKESLKTIRDTSLKMINSIDDQLTELQKDKEIVSEEKTRKSIKEMLSDKKEKVLKMPFKKPASKGEVLA